MQSIVRVSDGVFRIEGWAVDTRSGKPPRDLIFVDRSETIIGIARSGLRRPDLKSKVDAVPLDTVGWQGYVRHARTPAEQTLSPAYSTA